MPIRSYNQAKSNKNSKAPTRALEWKRLMEKTLARADKLKDRRAAGLRQAVVDGRAEPLLRRMGIISEADLLREFPEKAK